MALYLARRIGTAILMLLVLTLVIFVLIQLAPGNPEAYFLPQTVTDPGQRQRVIESLGLDQPFYVQYWNWLSHAVRGDFGTAYTYGQPVTEIIASRIMPTLQLQLISILVSVLIAIPVGLLAGARRGKLADRVVTALSLFGLSMPNFWFALMLVLVFSTTLGVLPSFGTGAGKGVLDQIPHYVLPVITLALATVPWYARFMRSSVIGTLKEDFIRSARARGFSEGRIVFGHALKASALPVITIIGLSLPRLIGGSVVVEAIFAWPGLGRLAYESVIRRDFPLIMAITLLTGAFVLVLNIITDVVYTRLDPRIRFD